MEYSNKEKQVLSLLKRTDFKNITKNEILNISSKLSELKPEVATQIVAQFPEFARLLINILPEYRQMISEIIKSDDESLQAVYNIANRELDEAEKDRQVFFDLANRVCDDLSKCLDNPELTPEQQKEICEHELEVLKQVDEKDREIREHEVEVMRVVDEKDSKKRKFNWKLIGTICGVVITVVGAAAAALGSTVSISSSDGNELDDNEEYT